ncbi:MAG: hypothetical protein ACTHQQ_11915 [Solirubrobacteraceae bacterium]
MPGAQAIVRSGGGGLIGVGLGELTVRRTRTMIIPARQGGGGMAAALCFR